VISALKKFVPVSGISTAVVNEALDEYCQELNRVGRGLSMVVPGISDISLGDFIEQVKDELIEAHEKNTKRFLSLQEVELEVQFGGKSGAIKALAMRRFHMLRLHLRRRMGLLSNSGFYHQILIGICNGRH